MVLSMLRLWGFRIPPLSYVFGYVAAVTVFGLRVPLAELFGMSPKGVFFGMGMSNFLAAIVAFLWFSRGNVDEAHYRGGIKRVALPYQKSANGSLINPPDSNPQR